MNDLIKREDAIKAVEDLPHAYNGWSDAYDKSYIIQTLEEVPSAELIEVHKYCWVKEFGGDGADCSHDFEPNGICQACGFMKISYAEPQQGEWIPCSERLPEENGKSYLTFQCGDDIGFGWCQVLRYDDGWNCLNGDKSNEIKYVVAWMPLPEPWKGAGDA